MSLRYTLLITGPAYGTQQASTAYLFAQALLAKGHTITTLFFYQDGVNNANRLISPASDEYNLLHAWQHLSEQYHIPLHVCIAAALRRGITHEQENSKISINSNIHFCFQMSGLGEMAQAMLNSDRVIQF